MGQPHYATPYLAPNCTGRTILYGVNYASGGGGIMNATGRIFVSHKFNCSNYRYIKHSPIEIISRVTFGIFCAGK